MNILEKIIAHKEIEIAKRKVEVPVGLLEQSPFFQRKTLSLQQSLLDRSKSGIIAEFKRRSPSKGNINEKANVEEVTRTYMQAGAAGISVLTDKEFFGALKRDFEVARQLDIPILRKDFMIDEYQVTEAKAMGADVILLIAACLTPARVKQLANFARSLDLEVLLELHGEDEMDHICDEISLTGDVKVISNEGEKIMTPEALGKRMVSASDIHGGNSVEEAADIFRKIIYGEGSWAQNAVVLANAAMALYATKEYKNYEDAYQAAVDSLESGKAKNVLDKLVSLQ